MSDPTPKEAPSIGLPKGSETCTVSIINAHCDFSLPPNYLIEPDVDGFKWLNLPTYTFHIKHNSSGAELIFDLGMRKDWENCPPHIAELVENALPGLKVGANVQEVLEEGGVKLSDLKAFILSHWHFDHSGNTASLPQSVDLIVGPGFKDEFLPGYPTKEGSPFWEADFKGRNVIEAPFDMKIGQYDAWDYFGDGSVYILNVPGHATGHISALVRTTPDTAIFMGGDVCHFTGDIRPSQYIPMPDPLPADAKLDARIPAPCPCSIFTECHPDQENARTSPFFKCSSGASSFYTDPPTAMNSIRALIEFDADPNILVLIAHDTGPLEVYGDSFFPKATISDWKEKGWKKKIHWHFLNELPIYGRQGREPRVDGLYKGGKLVKKLDGSTV